MKREFLKSIEGLTDEAIDKIMAEVGKDIEATKTKAGQATEKVSQELENLKSQLESKDQLINDANAQIEKFKGMDIEGIKNQAEEWKNKFTEFENQTKTEKEAYENKLKEQQYDFAVKEYLGTQKFTSDFTKNAFMEDFKKQQFKLGEDGKFLGADDYIKQFSEKNTGVFVVEEAPKDKTPSYEFTAPTGGQAPKAKMSLMEMMKLKNANPAAQLPIE